MSKLLRRLLPLAAAFAWRNRTQIAGWYRSRNGDNDENDKSGSDRAGSPPVEEPPASSTG